MAKRGAIKDSSAQGSTLKEQAIEQIRDDILRGKHKPGEIISATGLAQQMKESSKTPFSKTPIREAMESLVKDGLLKWIGVSGAEVIQFTPEDIYEILRMRSMIETAVAQTLCFVKTDPAIDMLTGLLEKAEKARLDALERPDEDRLREYYNDDVEFHCAIANNAGMMRAEYNIRRLMEHFRVYAIQHRGRTGDIRQEHEDILNSIIRFELEKQDDPIERDKGLKQVRIAVMRHMRGTAYRWAPGIVPKINAMWEGAPWPEDEEKNEEKSQPPRDEGSHPAAKVAPKASRRR